MTAPLNAQTPAPWRPEVFDAGDERAQNEIRRLMNRPGVRVHDHVHQQLEELVALAQPNKKLGAEGTASAIVSHLAGRPETRYGSWIHYPWSGALVHLLPCAEFRAVRTDRNRLKILPEEQARIGRARIAIAGLSVGLSAATTLVLEGVGGYFALADFDELGLSNLNRLCAPVSDLGVNKAVLAARRLFEIDPYLQIDIFPEGVTDENLDRFLGAHGSEQTLLVEECDDLYMKIRLRERARELRMPVLMETSDGGMLDIERFDLEPNRPLLHGLVPDIEATRLRGLATKDKVPIVLRILGVDHFSARTAASLIEVGQTLSTWPQLASAVALGGALVTDAARRVVLGTLNTSGRFRIDLSALLVDAPRVVDLAAQPSGVESRPIENRPMRVKEPVMSEPVDGLDPDVRFLLEHARLAPSGGNAQPWRFVVDGLTIECHLDETRSTNFMNFRHLGSYVAAGCAVENMQQAAHARGVVLDVEPVCEESTCVPVCIVRVQGRQEPAPTALFEHVGSRVTNRRLGERRPLHVSQRVALERAAAPAHVQWFESESDLEFLGTLHGRADRLRFLSQRMHRELMGEIRWTPEEVERTGDGLDVQTLELSTADRAALDLLGNWHTMSVLKQIKGGRGLEEMSRKAFVSSSAIAILQVPEKTPRAYFDGGRALQRLWLAATAEGLAVHPQGALVYLLARYDDAPDALSDDEREELADISRAFRTLVPRRDGGNVVVLRVSHADPPLARSRRRPLEHLVQVASAVAR